jgi:DNA-binding beta-propeller fold protein YncE
LSLTASALADDLYVLAGNTAPVLQKLDPATGSVLESHAVSGQEALFGGLGADASGALYSIDGYNDANPDRLFRIDAAIGAGAVVGPIGFNWNFRCVALNPATGVLIGSTDNALYTMNTGTGAATPVASITGANLDQLTAIAINAAGQCFGTDIGNTDLFSINLQTGQATWIGSVGQSGNWFNDLSFDSAGVLHGARFNGGVYRIDTTTGAQTFEFGGNYTGLLYRSAAVVCYANCDASTAAPVLNVQDFTCFLQKFAAGDAYANCDASTAAPVLNVQDFTCFLQKFAAGCQ